MRVTQKDIARRLGISQSLVAGVLGNREGVWVSHDNRIRILETAKAMGYRPNAAARALRNGRTNVVACVLFGTVGFHAVVETLADRLAGVGYDLLVKVIPDGERWEEKIGALISDGVCDVVALWGLERDTEAPAEMLRAAGKPFVVKGRFEQNHPDWRQIDFDHEEMVAQAAAHLASVGRDRVAYVGYDNGLIYARRLQDGFLKRAKGSIEFVASVPEGLDPVQRQMDEWFDLPEGRRPNGVIVGAGRTAWLAMELWLANKTVRIGDGPGDLAVSGLGGTDCPLLFGSAMAYGDADLSSLAAAMAELSLAPLLLGGYADSVVRVLPRLRPMPSLRLTLKSWMKQISTEDMQ